MKLFQYISKRYFIAISVFLIWMIFLDPTSYFIHKELDDQIEKLSRQKAHFENEIKKDEEQLRVLKTDSGLERYAREKYFMKREDESIFIINTDSIKKEK